jgi:hypothetical protein
MVMTPSEAYMIGFLLGCQSADGYRDEDGIPGKCLAAYCDGWEYGQESRKMAKHTANGFDVLEEVNKRAFEIWNFGQRSDLPDPPSGSGCRFHYCWMPVDTKGDNHWCKAHGGKDAPLPKSLAKKARKGK